MLKILFQMIIKAIKSGRGIFKFLFVIDNFIRLFTMTILIPIFFNWLGFGQILINSGLILGLVIDIHDFMGDFSSVIEK